MKNPIILIVSLFLLLFYSCNLDKTDNIRITDDKKKTVESKNDISINGSGKNSKIVKLNEGVAMFTMMNKGKRNFGVTLKNNKGEFLELLTHDIIEDKEVHTYSKSFNLEYSGDYIIEVFSYGNWAITIY